ncbi:MAG: 1,4-dihydroxy-2-naphthoate octaprenyltransferase [Bacteroidota bacterium]
MFKKLKPWLSAFRLRTLPLSVSGIIIGSCFAHFYGAFDGWIMCFALLVTVSLQVLSNLANDYGDSEKGTDNENRVGPMRAVQSGEISAAEMYEGIKVNIIIVIILTVGLLLAAFGQKQLHFTVLFFSLSILSIYAAIKYTVGSSPYGYRGLGDVFVFLFFGILSGVGSYFLYTKSLDHIIILPSIALGLLSVGVLNLNNMRDIESDELSNKRTLAVKLGKGNSKIYHLTIVILAMVVGMVFSVLYFKSFLNLIFLITYIPLLIHIKKIYRAVEPKDFDSQLKVLALTTFGFSLLLGLGYIL